MANIFTRICGRRVVFNLAKKKKKSHPTLRNFEELGERERWRYLGKTYTRGRLYFSLPGLYLVSLSHSMQFLFSLNVNLFMELCFWNRIVFLAATTYDVHRSIKNNEIPPSQQQIEALEDYISSVRRPPP